MNNGRFLTIMDLGRMQLVMRTGLLSTLWKKNWHLILGGSSIFYRRPLNPFTRFELKSQLVYWDEKWIYVKQSFLVKGQLHAVGLVRGIFKGKRGTVPPGEILEILGASPKSPPRPEEVRHLQLSLDELYAHTKT